MEYYNYLIQSANSQLELFQNITVIYFNTKEKADRSRLCAHTYCEVDYFRKELEVAGAERIKS